MHMTATLVHLTAWKRTLLLVVATAFALMAIAAAGAPSAQAWYCSPDGDGPWEHYDHTHDAIYHHYYQSGHTHSNGEHHHVWHVYKIQNYIQEMHINCV
jgi:Spy/CpxP family protein refolding chaperone